MNTVLSTTCGLGRMATRDRSFCGPCGVAGYNLRPAGSCSYDLRPAGSYKTAELQFSCQDLWSWQPRDQRPAPCDLQGVISLYTVLVNDLWSWQDGNPRLVAVDRVGLLATTCDPQGAIATTCDPQGAIIFRLSRSVVVADQRPCMYKPSAMKCTTLIMMMMMTSDLHPATCRV